MYFNSIFRDAPIKIQCPNCGSIVTIMINQVGVNVKCSNCSASIELQPDNSIKASIESLDEYVDELEDALNELDDALSNFLK